MKTIINISTFISLIILGNTLIHAQPCVTNSNIYNFTYNSKSYQIVKEMKNIADASSCATNLGGYLVEINDLAEQNAIYNEIVNNSGISSTYTTVSDGGGIAYIWIGASDITNEGTWTWDNIGTIFWTGQGSAGANNGAVVGGLYNNWGGTSSGSPKEPDNFANNQNGAAIAMAGWPSSSPGLLGVSGEWNDINTTNQIYYIVEYDCLLSFSTDTQSACNSFTWIDNITYTSSNNTATHNLTNSAGCDSIITLNLTITSNDLTLLANDAFISSNQDSVSYQWVDCDDNYSIINGEINQDYFALEGSYAVILSNNTCIDTSNCLFFTPYGIEIKSINTFNIYPNPSNGTISIDLNSDEGEVNISITDIAGKIIDDYTLNENGIINIEIDEKGVYFINISTSKLSEIHKVIVD